MDIYIYIYIYVHIQTIKDEKIVLCEYTTQSFMFYTFIRLNKSDGREESKH